MFEPISLREETLRSLQARGSGKASATGWQGDDDAELQAALDASRAAAGERGMGAGGDADLAAALAASRNIGGGEEERLMAAAIAASARDAKLAEQEEAALQVCCARNVRGGGGVDGGDSSGSRNLLVGVRRCSKVQGDGARKRNPSA